MRDVSDVVRVGVAYSVDVLDVCHEAAGAVGSEAVAVQLNAHLGADARVLGVLEAGVEGGALDRRAGLDEVDAEEVVLGERGQRRVTVHSATVRQTCDVSNRAVLHAHFLCL